MATKYPYQFEKLFNAEGLETFWQEALAKGDDRLQGHPLKNGKDWMKKTLPLFLHGDGVEFQKRDSMMVWSWGSLLTLFSSLDSHMLIAAFPKSCTCKQTWDPLMKELTWSFEALLKGCHPTKDSDGVPLKKGSPFFSLQGQALTPGRFRGALWSIQGDNEFFSNVLGLPHWSSHAPCWECDATHLGGAKPYKILDPAVADWVPKVMALEKGHRIFDIPGVTTRIVRGDGLHILFTKGIFAHLLGSMLHHMCWRDGVGKRQQVLPWKRVGLIFEEVQKVYKATGTPTRLTNLKLSMFTDPKSPNKEHAFLSAAKGAETKHFAPAFLAVCKKMLDLEDPVEAKMVAVLEALCDLVDVFDKAGIYLTDEEYAAALEKGSFFLQGYEWLNTWAQGAGRNLFHIVYKHHTFWHLVENSKWMNPRFHWCFRSEDFVGKISRLAHSISSGVRSTRLCRKVAPKYRVLLHVRLTRSNQDLQDPFAYEIDFADDD